MLLVKCIALLALLTGDVNYVSGYVIGTLAVNSLRSIAFPHRMKDVGGCLSSRRNMIMYASKKKKKMKKKSKNDSYVNNAYVTDNGVDAIDADMKKNDKNSGDTTTINTGSSGSTKHLTSNISARKQWATACKRLSAYLAAGAGRGESDGIDDIASIDEADEPADFDYDLIKPPAVFVDGYNMIGFRNDPMRHNNFQGYNNDDEEDVEDYTDDRSRLSSNSISDDRDKLISDMSVLQAATGWWIELIFDAYKNPRSAATAANTLIVDGVLVTYTSRSDTADTFIERRFQELRDQGFSNMVVATDDNVLRMVAGSNGAGYLSSAMLNGELDIAYRTWEKLEEQSAVAATLRIPTVGGVGRAGSNNANLRPDLKAAIEMMKQQNIAAAEAEAAAEKAADTAKAARLAKQRAAEEEALDGSDLSVDEVLQYLIQLENNRTVEMQTAARPAAPSMYHDFYDINLDDDTNSNDIQGSHCDRNDVINNNHSTLSNSDSSSSNSSNSSGNDKAHNKFDNITTSGSGNKNSRNKKKRKSDDEDDDEDIGGFSIESGQRFKATMGLSPELQKALQQMKQQNSG